MDLYLKCEVAFDYQNFISLTTVRGHCSRLIHPTTPKNVVYCVGYQRTVNPRSTCHILPPRVLLAFRPNSSHSFFSKPLPPPVSSSSCCMWHKSHDHFRHICTTQSFHRVSHSYASLRLEFSTIHCHVFLILAVSFLPLFFAWILVRKRNSELQFQL